MYLHNHNHHNDSLVGTYLDTDEPKNRDGDVNCHTVPVQTQLKYYTCRLSHCIRTNTTEILHV